MVSANQIFSDTGPAENYPLPSSPFSIEQPIDDYSEESKNDVQPYVDIISEGGRILASGNTTNYARSLASGAASARLQQWLVQFGTARVQFNTDRYGGWGHSTADLLVPLYDNQQSLLFVQGGIRKPSDRLTGNLGTGIRTFWHNGWMLGGNVFFDRDFTGNNRRVGIGGEAWTDYLRLSANTYIGTSQWHTSRDFDGTWQEKPADGYDVQAEGWLPSYPQLGTKLMWEQYYGNQVALFDKDHLQHNPHAITAGVEYTPVPLVTVAVDQKQGAGEHDTQVGLDLRWRFGQNWQWQTDPENVRSSRTLNGSRYELVNRNNEILLQYRKSPDGGVAHLTETLVTDNSPADGVTRNSVQVLATNRNGQPVGNASVNWSTTGDGSAALSTSAAITDASGLAFVTLTSTKVQTVPVNAQSGSVSAVQNSNFVAVSVSHIALAVKQDNEPADGFSQDVLVAKLTDSNDHPVTGQKVTWVTPDDVTVGESEAVSDSSGNVELHFASTVAGSADIRVTAGSQSASQEIHFKGNTASAEVSALTVTTDGSPADGKTANEAQAMVTDASGNPLGGQTVTWKSDKSTVTFSHSTVTDNNGKTIIQYTDTVAESLTLTATLANGNSSTASSLFVSDKDSARLKDLTVTSGAKASGSDTNTATVTVTDENGNVLSNIPVTFSSTGSAKVSTPTINTDGSGKAQITLTDTEAETVQVMAKLATGSSMTKDSRFVTDLDSLVLAATATSGAIADGKASNTVTVTLKDNRGKAVSSEVVTLEATGSAKLSAKSGTTDTNGQVLVTLTDTTAETVTITTSLSNGKKAETQTAFIGFSVSKFTASATSVKANESDTATLTATVTDSNGKTVANTPVIFNVTGNAALNAAMVTTDASGQAQVTLKDGTGEEVTVTAKAQDSGKDSGKVQRITFVASSITGVGIHGTNYIFTPAQGFPQTGFAGAQMYFLIDGSTNEPTHYVWTSNQSWVTFDSDGIATMKATQSSTIHDEPPLSSRQVTITATPKVGGQALTYTFTIKKWYTRSPVRASVRIGGENYAASACNGFGNAVVEPASELTDGAVSVVGKLFGEWRDSQELKKISTFFWDEDTTTTWRAGENIAFIYSTGVTDSASLPGSTYVMCRIN